jgi:hypothetical protein
MLGHPGFSAATSGTLWACAGSTEDGQRVRGKDCVGLMSWFSLNGGKTNGRNEGPVRPDPLPASWRDEKVEDPFDDPQVRKRIADVIIRSVIKPNTFGV